MKDLSERSVDELRGMLKSARSIQITVAVIFAIIILAWLVLGYWRTNVPVFISTIAVALTALAATSMAPQRLSAEIANRVNTDSQDPQ